MSFAPRRTSAANRRRSTPRRTTPAKPKPAEPVAANETETKNPVRNADEKPAETGEKVADAEKAAEETNAPGDDKAAAEKKSTTPSFRTLTGRRRPAPAKKTAPEPKPDPLASINLVILFKDGNLIEKPMSEVFKFSVDKGVLTVALKDGSTSRYKIVDVEKVTIQ